MSATSLLGLPLIDAAQSQKHVTHNEALLLLDANVHLAVSSRNMGTPPTSPAESDRYLVGGTLTGAFEGQGNAVACWQSGAWTFLVPRAGWRVYVVTENLLLVFDGTNWCDPQINLRALQNLDRLGIGTAADDTNNLAAKLNTSLFTARSSAEGGSGDLRMVMSKNASANTLSHVYQTNFSGRAEAGLTGDDHYRIKVSADGANWSNAVDIDPTNGKVVFPCGIGGAVRLSFRNRIINGNFGINQRNYASGTVLPANAYAHDRWKANASNSAYTFVQTNPAPFSVPGLVDTLVTVTAGSLAQVIEPNQIEGGSYCLSWVGTSKALVQYWSGSAWVIAAGWSSSPLVAVDIPVGSTVFVSFGTGTLGAVQFEPGTVASSFERRPRGLELALCQRYFETGYCRNRMFTNGVGISSIGTLHKFQVAKRATPTITLSAAAYANAANAAVAAPTPDAFVFVNDSPGGNPITDAAATFAASAEL
jgi:hypothetical protein